MTERKTVYRVWWVWNFEQEEQWLNTQALEGWALEGVGLFTYHFVRCAPGEYTIRLEMHGFDESYLNFVEDTGAEYVGRVLQWQYFRKKSELGAFDLFSDIDSRVRHLERIARVITLVGAGNILIGIANSFRIGCGWINLLCGCLLMYALGRIRGKEEQLNKERALHE